MSNMPVVDTSSLQWRFGRATQENLPGAFLDQLIRDLLTIPSSQWLEACQIWMTGHGARKFALEEADLIVRLAQATARKKLGVQPSV
jgi:hypothetical protein